MAFLPIRPSGLFLPLIVFAYAAPSPARDAGPDASPIDTAIFAGGSFWCLEPVFEGLPGVDSVLSGYTGGQGPDPDFESVSSGNSAYVEAVEVFYHPKRIGYPKLLDAYWRNIDPTRADGQFSDEGLQFRTIIFYRNASEQAAAAASLKRLEKSKRFSRPLVTEIAPAGFFYPAEAEHQDYYRKSAARYKTYLRFSGREAFLKKAWGRPPKSGK
ncbi:MAG TPA: peptide-methionine (S)-S-oxide reductase MsrA [Fibrobacteria bacterium]|nr:peptide-methionine (S)-S-oxide reductase MsrA [Fibrobacteria bacterium]